MVQSREGTTDEETAQLILRVLVIVGTPVFVGILAASYRRFMRKSNVKWETVAGQHGLQFVENPVTLDYGSTGTRTFPYPGMAGNYRGRQVEVKLGARAKAMTSGVLFFASTVQVKPGAPYVALTHKCKFDKNVTSRIPKDTPTNNHAIDRDFHVRSDDPPFVVRLLERVPVRERLKPYKFRTAHLTLDGGQLVFDGEVKSTGFNAKSKDAIALLDVLCDVAEAVEAREG